MANYLWCILTSAGIPQSWLILTRSLRECDRTRPGELCTPAFVLLWWKGKARVWCDEGSRQPVSLFLHWEAAGSEIRRDCFYIKILMSLFRLHHTHIIVAASLCQPALPRPLVHCGWMDGKHCLCCFVYLNFLCRTLHACSRMCPKTDCE